MPAEDGSSRVVIIHGPTGATFREGEVSRDGDSPPQITIEKGSMP